MTRRPVRIAPAAVDRVLRERRFNGAWLAYARTLRARKGTTT